jgi:hypothetical protein
VTQNPDVDLIFINPLDDYEDGTNSGIEVKADILTKGSADVSGDGKVEIYYNDDAKVYSSSVKVSNSRLSRKIPWNEFAIGNKPYQLKVSYGGKSAKETFSLSQDFHWAICEKVNITTQLDPPQYNILDLSADPILKITTRFEDKNGRNLLESPKDLELELSIQYENDAPITQKVAITGDDLRSNDYIYNYDYHTGGGNYTITATVKNLFADQEDSEFATVTSDEYKELINLWPLALYEINGETPSGDTYTVSNNEEVTFDASNSINDGDIISYEWDFSYDDTNFVFSVDETGKTTTWSFSGRGSSYVIALRIKGDVFVDDPNDQNPNPIREVVTNVDITIQVALFG